MITILTQPKFFNFSRNPLIYTISSPTPMDTPGLFISVKLFFNGGAVPVIELPLSLDNIGRSTVDIKGIADSLLEYDLPGRAAVARMLTRQRGLIQLSFHEATTAIPTDPAPAVSNQVVIIKGGMAYQIWQPSFFTTYDNPHKFYFSWWPSGREVAPWQKLFLNYLHTGATVAAAELRATVYYNDGSTDTKIMTVLPANMLEQNKLYRLPTGFNDLGLDALQPDSIAVLYEVYVTDADGVPLYPAYQYRLDHVMDYEKVVLSFFSSLGNMETLRLTGEVDAAEERESTSAELFVSGQTNFRIPPSIVVASINMRETYKGNIGWCDLRTVQELRRDLFYSLQAYWIINGRYWPIEVLNKTVDRGRLSGQVHEMAVEWAFGFRNSSFTPNDVLIPIHLLAVDDVYSVYKNSWLTIGAPGVMANDEDEAPGTLSVIPGTFTSENGVLVLNADGSFTYTPNEGYVGTDIFPYTLLNELGQTDTANITIIVKEMETGFIVLWSGALDAIPAGWALCDGTNGTPDLKGRFVVGYDAGDPDYNAIDGTKIGGTKAVGLTGSQNGPHTHNINDINDEEIDANGTGGPNGYTKNGGTKATASSGTGAPHENRPPYYTLAYLMKL